MDGIPLWTADREFMVMGNMNKYVAMKLHRFTENNTEKKIKTKWMKGYLVFIFLFIATASDVVLSWKLETRAKQCVHNSKIIKMLQIHVHPFVVDADDLRMAWHTNSILMVIFGVNNSINPLKTIKIFTKNSPIIGGWA